MSSARALSLAALACLAALALALGASPRAASAAPAQQTTSPPPSATPPPTDTPAPSATRPPASASPTDRVATPSATGPTPTATGAAGPEERPFLVLVGSSTQPGQPAPGSAFHLDLVLENQGDADARNVQLWLSSESFVATGGSSNLFEDKIKDGEDETLGTEMTVVEAATPGVHAIQVELRYEDREGNAYSDKATVGVTVAPAGARRPVVVVQAVRMPARVAPGFPFTLALDLANTGSQPADNVLVSPAAGPLALQGGGGSTPLFIPAGGLATVALKVAAASPQTPGSASQTLDLSYNGPSGESYTGSHVVGLVITGGAATDPLPMVTGYRAGDALGLHPGQVFELSMDIANVGAADALRTVLALGGGTAPASSGTSGGGTGGGGSSLGVFAPLDTSNVRYLGRLPAGGSTQLTQRLVVDGAAKPGPYVLELTFNYVDVNGQALSSSEVISLVVSRRVLLGVTATDPISTTEAGLARPFPIEVLNQGANTVNVTEVAVRGTRNMTVTDGSRFIGQLDAGASDTLEPLLTAGKPGPAEVEVTVTYLDDFNNPRRITRTYPFTVTAATDHLVKDEEAAPDEGNLILRALKGFLGLGASAPVRPPPLESAPAEGSGGAGPPSGAVRIRSAP